MRAVHHVLFAISPATFTFLGFTVGFSSPAFWLVLAPAALIAGYVVPARICGAFRRDY